jgi:hypothetical protein
VIKEARQANRQPADPQEVPEIHTGSDPGDVEDVIA